ncbi:type II secretion system protein GspD, partial [Planctomycetota bacterium]
TRPAKTKRTAKTTVTIPDKDTVIIGGLTRDNMNTTEKKIPLLGDIPLLGALFRWTKTEGQKTNLCIFITPHIMKRFSELADKTREYKEPLERLKEKD